MMKLALVRFQNGFQVAVLITTLILSMCFIEKVGALTYDVTQFSFPGAGGTGAYGINDRTQIVGYSWNEIGSHGFLLDGLQFSSIDYPGSLYYTNETHGINNSGQIAGTYYLGGPDLRHGYLLSGGTFSEAVYPGAISTTATAINDRGQIVGWYGLPPYDVPETTPHSYLYNNGQYYSIDFPGVTSMFGTRAYDINNRGQIVGTYQSAGTHGFLYINGAYFTIEFPGALSTSLYGINDSGDIIGVYLTESGYHPFIYNNGQFVRVDLPGTPYGINNQGQIVGSTDGGNGFLATPVPEPATILLFGPGLFGLMGLRRKFLK